MKSLNIVMAWELGGNFGHLVRMLSIAKELRLRGYNILFAVRDSRMAELILAEHSFSYVQAPVAFVDSYRWNSIFNYDCILGASGLSSQLSARGLVQSWIGLYRAIDPHLVIADHAPSSIIAAKCLNIKTVAIGTGFEIPPKISPPPRFPQFDNIGIEEQHRVRDGVVNAVNSCLEKYRASPIKYPHDIFSGSLKIVTSAEFLDHYGPREDILYVGWPRSSIGGERFHLNRSMNVNIVVYYKKSYGGYSHLLRYLHSVRGSVLFVCPDCSDFECISVSKNGVIVTNRVVDIIHQIRSADLVIHHGGIGITSESIMSKKPSVILPEFTEQLMTCNIVESIGLGRRLHLDELNGSPSGIIEMTMSSFNLFNFEEALLRQLMPRTTNEIVDSIVEFAGR